MNRAYFITEISLLIIMLILKDIFLIMSDIPIYC